MTQDKPVYRPKHIIGTVCVAVVFYGGSCTLVCWLLLDWLPFYIGGN